MPARHPVSMRGPCVRAAGSPAGTRRTPHDRQNGHQPDRVSRRDAAAAGVCPTAPGSAGRRDPAGKKRAKRPSQKRSSGPQKIQNSFPAARRKRPRRQKTGQAPARRQAAAPVSEDPPSAGAGRSPRKLSRRKRPRRAFSPYLGRPAGAGQLRFSAPAPGAKARRSAGGKRFRPLSPAGRGRAALCGPCSPHSQSCPRSSSSPRSSGRAGATPRAAPPPPRGGAGRSGTGQSAASHRPLTARAAARPDRPKTPRPRRRRSGKRPARWPPRGSSAPCARCRSPRCRGCTAG